MGQNAICQHRLRYVGFIIWPKFSYFCSHTALCHQYFDLYKSSVIQCGSLILKTVAVFAYSKPFNLTGKLIFAPSPDFKQEKHGKPNPWHPFNTQFWTLNVWRFYRYYTPKKSCYNFWVWPFFFRKKIHKILCNPKNNLCTCRGFNSDATDLPHSKFELLNPNFLIWCHLFGLQLVQKWEEGDFFTQKAERYCDRP